MQFGTSFYPLERTARVLGNILFLLNRIIKRFDHRPRGSAVTVDITHVQGIPPAVGPLLCR